MPLARRGGRLAAFLRGVAVAPLDEDLGRRSGALLGRTRKSDVIDAAVVLLAADGDSILSSDISSGEGGGPGRSCPGVTPSRSRRPCVLSSHSRS